MNVLLAIILFLIPLAGPGAFVFVLAIVVAVTAYHGPRASVVYRCIAVLMGIELLYGLHLGSLSLSYALAAFLIVAVRHLIALTPWNAVDGWRFTDMLRTTLVALSMLVVAGGVHPLRVSGWAVGIIVLCLIILRRMDVPFRRAIHFGM